MLKDHFRFSDEYVESIALKEKVEKFYQKGLDMVRGGTLYGYKINLNNPKEVIAALYLLADDFSRYHERF